jgi:hypothetical protein
LGKNDQSYFTQRAAEELAAAERSTCAAAASAHRELSLRYSLKIILPDSEGANDDSRPIGQAKRQREHQPTAAPRRRAPKRSRG